MLVRDYLKTIAIEYRETFIDLLLRWDNSNHDCNSVLETWYTLDLLQAFHIEAVEYM